MAKANLKKAFTLVELSIVLVIIGLLIGGILTAQSMISTAKISNAIREINQYGVAVANFKTKFNQIPGDSTLFENTVTYGAAIYNDGLIQQDETIDFWKHLSEGVGFKNKEGNNYIIYNYSGTNEDLPRSCPMLNIAGTSDRFCMHAYNAGSVNAFFYANAGAYGIPNSSGAYDPLLAQDVLAIDTKIDNGLADSGNVTGFTAGSSTVGTCATAAAYNVTDKDYKCSMSIMWNHFPGTM